MKELNDYILEHTSEVCIDGVTYHVTIDKEFHISDYGETELWHAGKCNTLPVYVKRDDVDLGIFWIVQGAGMFARIRQTIIKQIIK